VPFRTVVAVDWVHATCVNLKGCRGSDAVPSVLRLGPYDAPHPADEFGFKPQDAPIMSSRCPLSCTPSGLRRLQLSNLCVHPWDSVCLALCTTPSLTSLPQVPSLSQREAPSYPCRDPRLTFLVLSKASQAHSLQLFTKQVRASVPHFGDFPLWWIPDRNRPIPKAAPVPGSPAKGLRSGATAIEDAQMEPLPSAEAHQHRMSGSYMHRVQL